jgi:hypothetical protein
MPWVLVFSWSYWKVIMTEELPARIQLRRTKGWRLPVGAVRVARPGKWGNPFSVAEHGREQAIALFSAYLDQQLAAGALDIMELRGKDLACWCRLDEPCHADVLIKRANALEDNPYQGSA